MQSSMLRRRSSSTPTSNNNNAAGSAALFPRRRSSFSTSSATGTAAAPPVASKVSAMIGAAADANYIPPYVHLSMLVHPDGIALYAKMQTDPFFRQSLTDVLSRAGGALTHSAVNSVGHMTAQNNVAAQTAFFAAATSLRAQLASNKAVVDVARAAYQHPTTAPVLRFQMPFGATPESVAAEGIMHFKTLLYEQGYVDREQYEADDFEELIPCGGKSKDEDDDDDEAAAMEKLNKILASSVGGAAGNQPSSSGEGAALAAFAASLRANNDSSKNDGAAEESPLEMYVYHVEDPNLLRMQQAESGEHAVEQQQQQLQVIGATAPGANKKGTKPVATLSHVAQHASKANTVAAGASSRVSHRAIEIGNYDRYPPLAPGVPIRVQLNLFQLIAAARKRRRKFIVRAGLHPSAVEECSPLNIYAVLAIGPKWLERRALEVQEETARLLVAKNESRYMMAIHEAHAVSHNRATMRARGHKQLRVFHGEIESMFLRLVLRDALVKQASMSVHDVVQAHMKQWPDAMKQRESLFQEGLKVRRCLLADVEQQFKLLKKRALLTL